MNFIFKGNFVECNKIKKDDLSNKIENSICKNIYSLHREIIFSYFILKKYYILKDKYSNIFKNLNPLDVEYDTYDKYSELFMLKRTLCISYCNIATCGYFNYKELINEIKDNQKLCKSYNIDESFFEKIGYIEKYSRNNLLEEKFKMYENNIIKYRNNFAAHIGNLDVSEKIPFNAYVTLFSKIQAIIVLILNQFKIEHSLTQLEFMDIFKTN